MKLPFRATVIALVVLAVAIPAAIAATTDTVKATEFKFALSKKTVSRGTVTFKIKNAGHLKHDFKINGKKSKLLNPGGSTTLKVTFRKAGKYTYICTVAGHAKAGMKGRLTVK
jgi:uncharacterized cupredoxin-like copper-binding protein